MIGSNEVRHRGDPAGVHIQAELEKIDLHPVIFDTPLEAVHEGRRHVQHLFEKRRITGIEHGDVTPVTVQEVETPQRDVVLGLTHIARGLDHTAVQLATEQPRHHVAVVHKVVYVGQRCKGVYKGTQTLLILVTVRDHRCTKGHALDHGAFSEATRELRVEVSLSFQHKVQQRGVCSTKGVPCETYRKVGKPGQTLEQQWQYESFIESQYRVVHPLMHVQKALKDTGHSVKVDQPVLSALTAAEADQDPTLLEVTTHEPGDAHATGVILAVQLVFVVQTLESLRLTEAKDFDALFQSNSVAHLTGWQHQLPQEGGIRRYCGCACALQRVESILTGVTAAKGFESRTRGELNLGK
mmetsp:Transcript_17860/g.53673  ORF Transcript_17860/g.53673 Transcript_17860/m.53673 type:complete len:354 (+) Transcript_17860:1778-2839(+)